MALMSPTDSMFLIGESREQPMHVGALQDFELPDGADPDLLRTALLDMLQQTDVAPLFRRRPYRSLTTLGQWGWTDDVDVDLEHHVRHSALPQPGRVRELLALVSRLHSTLLDRHRPLWEVHLIEGLEGNRFAVYTKLHHSVMDGVSGMRLLQRALSPDPAQDQPAFWTQRPPRRARKGSGGNPLLTLPKATIQAIAEMTQLTPRVLRLVEQNALPSTPLTAMTPVSLRKDEDGESTGNSVGAILANLATNERDPERRLTVIAESTRRAKGMLRGLSQLQVTALSAGVMLPMAVNSVTGMYRFGTLPFNIVISNVPGPKESLYLHGARLSGLYPLSIPTNGQAMNITATSYTGDVGIGLTACRRSVPRVQRMLGGLERSLDELV